MKAFMSHPGPRGDKGWPATAARKAEREACAILTVTEPNTTSIMGGHFSPCDGYRYMGDVWTGPIREGNAHAALAEALAAWVTE